MWILLFIMILDGAKYIDQTEYHSLAECNKFKDLAVIDFEKKRHQKDTLQIACVKQVF